jgi:hypothetical protein
MRVGTEADARSRLLATIAMNIKQHGFHVYAIGAGVSPGFYYTIGLTKAVGYELVLAGAALYSVAEAGTLVNALGQRLRRGAMPEGTHGVRGMGSFRLHEAHRSWVRRLLLGARDYYGHEVRALQIMPDHTHRTIDIPDMRVAFGSDAELAWNHLVELWPKTVPTTSEAVTNVDALRGIRVTIASRWEEDYWEIFAGDPEEIDDEDMRVVPLGTILAADPTLARALTLSVGSSIWRDDDAGEWQVLDGRNDDEELVS